MIISFIGSMGSGKTTCMNIVREEIGSLFTKNVKFAQPLYDIQEMIYNRINMDVNGEKDRLLLQLLGTDWGRTKDKDLWINLWKKDVRKAFMNGLLVFNDDCRFMNEFDAIKEMGGLIIKVVGDSRCDTKHSSHSSEKDIHKMQEDFTIYNTGTMDELRVRIKSALIPYLLAEIDNENKANFIKTKEEK